jgi:hypothetical protein
VAQVTEIRVAGVCSPYLDVTGTYKFNPMPFDPNSKVEHRPGQRLLCIHYEGKEDVYLFRLCGPATTVANYKQGFEDWLKRLRSGR